MFSLTTSRALLIAGLNVACQVASFSLSTPFSAHNRLPAETLLSTPSKVPRELKTQLAVAGKEPKISKALCGLFGCPTPWRGVFPPQNTDDVNLFTLGIVHKEYSISKVYFKTKITLTAKGLGDVVEGRLPDELESVTRSDGTPFQAQSLKTHVTNSGHFNAMIENVGVSIGGNNGSVTDVFGIRRMVRSVNHQGEDDLVEILKQDDLGLPGHGNGPQAILQYVRRITGQKDAKKIVIVTAVIIADLAASIGTNNGWNVAAKVPLLPGGGFDFELATNLDSSSKNQVVLAQYVGWNYEKHQPLSPGNFEIYKME